MTERDSMRPGLFSSLRHAVAARLFVAWLAAWTSVFAGSAAFRDALCTHHGGAEGSAHGGHGAAAHEAPQHHAAAHGEAAGDAGSEPATPPTCNCVGACAGLVQVAAPRPVRVHAAAPPTRTARFASVPAGRPAGSLLPFVLPWPTAPPTV